MLPLAQTAGPIDATMTYKNVVRMDAFLVADEKKKIPIDTGISIQKFS